MLAKKQKKPIDDVLKKIIEMESNSNYIDLLAYNFLENYIIVDVSNTYVKNFISMIKVLAERFTYTQSINQFANKSRLTFKF